jgi:ankyrin repeat protein
VQYLIEKGADVRARNDEALRNAAENGHLAVVQYLIEKGANVRARDDEALREAAHNGHKDVVQYLENVIKELKKCKC